MQKFYQLLYSTSILFLLPMVLFGNNQINFKAKYSPKAVIVEIDESTTDSQIKEILDPLGKIEQWEVKSRIPQSNYIIVFPKTQNFTGFQFLEYLKMNTAGNQEIKGVFPFLVNKSGKLVGVIPELLITISNAFQETKLEKWAHTLNFNIEKLKHLPGIRKLRLERSSIQTIFATLETLRSSGQFEAVQLNPIFFPEVCTNDTYFDRQWNITNDGSTQQFNGTPGADMSVEDAWAITMGSPDIKVGVLDSGVDTLHPDLVANLILPGFDAVSDSTDGAAFTDLSQQGHGTACSGIIAAEADNNEGVAGVAPLCKIVPIRVFVYTDLGGTLGIQPFSNADIFASGIRWQWQVAGVDVSSNSWGVPDDLIVFVGGQPIVDAAIDSAINFGRNGLGLPMLFSSGNDDSVLLWPSRRLNTIAVGATSMCDERKSPASCDNEAWWGGNYGTGLDISAPGVKAATCDQLGTAGYNNTNYTFTFNGTSTACPNAAAVMALMYSVNPFLSRWDATYLIQSTCDTVGGYDYSTQAPSGSWSEELGYGRVNAHRAVLAAQNYVPTSTTNLQDGTMNVYPNPAKQELNISVNESFKQGLLQIESIFGTKVLQQQFINPRSRIDVSKLPAGLYLITLQIAENRYTTKCFITPK